MDGFKKITTDPDKINEAIVEMRALYGKVFPDCEEGHEKVCAIAELMIASLMVLAEKANGTGVLLEMLPQAMQVVVKQELMNQQLEQQLADAIKNKKMN